jgi:hypothetical protein
MFGHHDPVTFRRVATTAVAALALTTCVCPATADAVETGVCAIEILVDGRPLTEYAARGTTYIEALRGREYSVRLSNRSDRRIAVALAVDGLNSIDARTTDAKSASKWVLGPRESITIDGWQTSTDTARRFYFTTEEQSYGQWLGRPDNLGVIEAVVFRERETRQFFNEGEPSASAERRRQAPAGAQPQVKADAGKASESAPDELAATGIGRRVDRRVQRVRLDLEDRPSAELRVRYEYRPQLVHLGVLPSTEEQQALARRERARGFGGLTFAPDPFAHGR